MLIATVVQRSVACPRNTVEEVVAVAVNRSIDNSGLMMRMILHKHRLARLFLVVVVLVVIHMDSTCRIAVVLVLVVVLAVSKISIIIIRPFGGILMII